MHGNEQQSSLTVTEFLDWDNDTVRDYTEQAIGNEHDPVQQIIKLFETVRDKIRYDVYGVDMTRNGMKASSIIRNRAGFCVHKSIVFAAGARYLGIPSRLVFSDVKNHLIVPVLKSLVGNDVFHHHGYAEVMLNRKWVKATPVFNSMLCCLFGIDPLGFDGEHDFTLQSYNRDGNKSFEFTAFHGTFDDLPYTQCVRELNRYHPQLFPNGNKATTRRHIEEISLARA